MAAGEDFGDLLTTPEGTLLAVCPSCGAGSVIAPVLSYQDMGEQTMYLGCVACSAPFQVTGDFVLVVAREEVPGAPGAGDIRGGS